MPERVFGRGSIETVHPHAHTAPHAPAGQALNPERDPRVLAELQPGERLLWAAHPVRTPMGGPRLIARAGAVFFIMFSLIWIGVAMSIAVFANAPTTAPGPGGFAIVAVLAALMGLVPLAIGIALLVGASRKRWAPDRFLYALTTDRCIIWSPTGLGSASVVSLSPADLRHMQRQEKPDGSGNLILARETRVYATNTAAPGPVGAMSNVHETIHGFLAIADVAKVERLVREAFNLGGPVRDL